MEYQIHYENAIANKGNTARLAKLMMRAEHGESLKVGFLGGSITQGSLSTKPELCYAYHVYEWWCQAFPKADFTYINAGIGGTTSEFGAARVESDLLSYEPDFVIVEFSVNDESTPHFMETYEGLIRYIYQSKTAPAIVLVHNVLYDDGGNAQLMHGRIARYYDLPSVSMQSSIYPEVVAGRIENRDITPDDLHPNDKGHALVASVITYYLDKIKKETEHGKADTDELQQVPKPLTQNGYEHSVRYQVYNSTPDLNGFRADLSEQKNITEWFKRGFMAEKTGDTIIFHIKAESLSVQYRKSVNKPAPVAEVVVDGDTEHAVILDANFEEDWGDKLELTDVLVHGELEEHEIVIRLIETHPDDAVPFYLVSVIGSNA